MTNDQTLNAFFPAHTLRVGGESLSIRPLILRELLQAQTVKEGWATMVASGGVHVPEEAWECFLILLAGACNRDLVWVKNLETKEFERLASYALALNEELWNSTLEADSGEDVFTWAAIIQQLVEHGHPWASIQEMTLGQLRVFLEEALGLERDRFALAITAASFAMADGKSVQKATKELRRGR